MILGIGLPIWARALSSSAFTPASLTGVAHWYRADLANVTLVSGAVSQWNDLIGTAHLVQATAGNRPAHNASDAAYNGQPTVQATSTGMRMLAASTTSSQPCTIWVVGENGTAGSVLVGLGDGSAANHPIIYDSSGVAIFSGSTISSGVTSSAKHATLATFNGASSFVGADNWLTGGTSGSAGTGTGSDISIFAYDDGTFAVTGKIAELVIQAAVPTAGEKTNMASYFARYGITVT